VCIGVETSQQEQAELLAFLDKNSDVFVWSISDLVGLSKDIIERRLQVNPSMKRIPLTVSQGRNKSGSTKRTKRRSVSSILLEHIVTHNAQRSAQHWPNFLQNDEGNSEASGL
jgi:hypothetical protein